MQRIDRLIIHARRQANGMEYAELKRALGKMTTEQLRELTEDNIPNDRIFQIFDSAGALYLVKG